jgi:hypothetical protein
MFLKMDIVQERGMYCDEIALATTANYWGSGYEMAFLKCWNFGFLSEGEAGSSLLNERIELKDFYKEELLEKYHGIKKQQYTPANHDEFLKIIENELSNNRPVVCLFNPTKYSWVLEEDVEKGVPGFFLITGYDDFNDYIYFIDIHILKKVVQMDIEEFLKGYLTLYLFSMEKDFAGAIEPYSISKKIANEAKGEAAGKSIFEAMRSFASYIEGNNQLMTEQDGYNNPFEMPLMKKLDYISRSRALISHTMKYLAKISGNKDFDHISIQFLNSANKWNNVREKFLRAFWEKSKNFNLSISKVIMDIAGLEESIADILLQMEPGKSIIKPEKRIDNIMENVMEVKAKEVVSVSIEKYCNSKAFHVKPDEEIIADILGNGFSFAADDLKEKVLKAGEMEYMWTMPGSNKYDNIYCEEQIIDVPPDNYIRIAFMGCGVWGNQEGDVVLSFEDGREESVRLCFNDWYTAELLTAGKRVWEGNSCERLGMEITGRGKRYIFANEFKMNSSSKLVSVKLPDNACIHLFAVSLGKE